MIIVPNSYDYSKYSKLGSGFIGTNKFKVSCFSIPSPAAPSSATRTTRALPGRSGPSEALKIDVTFYPDEGPMAVGPRGRVRSTPWTSSPSTSARSCSTGNWNVIKLKCALQRQLSMRCDQHPFTSKYVRQAIAFTLDRPAIIKALFDGDAVVGNDNPFYPGFRSYNSSVPSARRT